METKISHSAPARLPRRLALVVRRLPEQKRLTAAFVLAVTFLVVSYMSRNAVTQSHFSLDLSKYGTSPFGKALLSMQQAAKNRKYGLDLGSINRGFSPIFASEVKK